MNENAIASFDTCDLVEELKRREAVDAVIVLPNEERRFRVEGPAVVLIVYD